MDFELSDRAKELKERLETLMDEHVYPAEPTYHEQIQASGNPHFHPPVMEELKSTARTLGLWNLWLANDEHGAGLQAQQQAQARVHDHDDRTGEHAHNSGAGDHRRSGGNGAGRAVHAPGRSRCRAVPGHQGPGLHRRPARQAVLHRAGPGPVGGGVGWPQSRPFAGLT